MTWTLLAGAALTAVALSGQSKITTPPPPKDPYPNGCVSCHVKTPDGKDARIHLETKKVPKHPDISAIVKVVPTDCMKCHKPAVKTPTLGVAVHKAHFINGEKSVFATRFKGDCNTCHRLDVKTYKMGVKSGPKNW